MTIDLEKGLTCVAGFLALDTHRGLVELWADHGVDDGPAKLTPEQADKLAENLKAAAAEARRQQGRGNPQLEGR